jgi:hypothetical protein
MADSLGAYFTKLVEPVRNGAQNNTAQSMTLALDYADVARDTKLRAAVVSAARKLYLADTTCATQLERVIPAAAGRGGSRRRRWSRSWSWRERRHHGARCHDAKRSDRGRDAVPRRHPRAGLVRRSSLPVSAKPLS